jgi:hypothetical protein
LTTAILAPPPRCFSMKVAITRAVRSVPPPGAKATIMLIGLSG